MQYTDNEAALIGGLISNYFFQPSVDAKLRESYRRVLREPCVVELYSDSKYVIDALEKGWAWGWRKKGWVKSDKKPALNPDLWEMLLGLVSQHEMHYHWVKGHEENEKNNRCDEQAVLESRKFKVS